MAEFIIPIRGTDKTITFDEGKLSIEYLKECMYEYFEMKINKRGSKFGTIKDATEASLVENAQTNVEALYAEKPRRGGAKKAKKADSARNTMAMKLCKDSAKAQVRAGGVKDDRGNVVKVSKVSAAEWTRTAKVIFDADPDKWLRLADEELARAAGIYEGAPAVSFVINEDPKKVKAAAEAAAKKKAQAAGKTAPPPPQKKGGKPVARHAN